MKAYRARRKRPRNRAAAEKCDELTPITHSDYLVGAGVVESLHHVRWVRLLLRPFAKTSESGPRRRKVLSLFPPQNRADHTSDEANSVGQ